MEPSVRDSVGQTASLPAAGLGDSIEEDGRVRPRSVDLLGDSRVIDSKEPEGSEMPGDISGRREEIMVQSLRSSSAVRVQLYLNGMGIEATVDTAADVTIVAEHLWEKLETPPATINKVVMYTAGKEQTLQASRVGPVTIKMGRHSSLETIYSAPIQDDMLLGLDYLKKYKATVDLDQEKLLVHGEQFPFVSEQSDTPRISKVWVLHPTRIAPNTAVTVQCRVEGVTKGDIMVESMGDELTVMPTVLISGGKPPVVCLINLSDSELSVPSTSPIGEAQEVDILDGSILLGSSAGDKDGNMESGPGKDLPEHLQEMFHKSSMNLSEEQKNRFRELLAKHSSVFASSDLDLGEFSAVEHTIETGAAMPIKQKMRRTPIHFVGEERKHLEQMLRAGVIQPSSSEWAAPPVLERKKDGNVRWCIDYRKLNKVTKKDVFPLPLIEDCMDALQGNVWFSKLDANSAYWQIPLESSAREKTAFVTKDGLFEFVRMPFGLCNSPATYSRAMGKILDGLTWKTVLAFLDDICVLGKSVEDHFQNLDVVLQRFSDFGLKLKPRKCEFFRTQVSFLGRVVSQKGVELSPDSVEAIQGWSTPTSVKGLMSFLGLVNYHRQFIQGFSDIAAPLYAIVGAKKEFVWGPEQERAFAALKAALLTPPVLSIPTADDPFILDTDASDGAVAAELIQVQDGVEKVIAYGSFALTAEQRRYCTTRKELLAIIRFTRQFRTYLLGRPFRVRTDHASLVWLLNFKHPEGQLARWLEELGQYDMTILHRPGRLHQNADALSRMPVGGLCENYQGQGDLAALPCGGCPYCSRAHKNWNSFLMEVDDVGQLRDQGVHMLPISGRVQRVSWAQALTPEEIRDAQKNDEELAIIVKWLEGGGVPDENVLAMGSPAMKFYWVNKDLMKFKDTILMYSKGDKDVILTPRGLVESVLNLAHNIPSGGHQGVHRTKARVKDRFFWYRMTKDIRHHVLGCGVCSLNKKAHRKARGELNLFHAGSPMERVHLDFLGPLPRTAAGNENILVLVDQFTKWVECIALPDQTALTTAKAMVEVFGRLGFPLEIFTDQGRNFESELFKSVCDLLHIHKARTTPYHPSSNGQVERFNRTLMDAVRCFVGDQDEWDLYLPQISAAMRSSINRSTGFTPNRLMLGREVVTPLELVHTGGLPHQEERDADDYVAGLEQGMRRAHELARDILKTGQKHMKKSYDLRLYKHQYSEASLVYVLDTAVKVGDCAKLVPPWKGPGVVTEVITPYLYKVRLRDKYTVFNHDRLKPCLLEFSALPAWIRKHLQRSKSGNRDLFCHCNEPDSGTPMVHCDNCLEWYHVACVGLTMSAARRLSIFICKDCGP